jgi:hypothetical protein
MPTDKDVETTADEPKTKATRRSAPKAKEDANGLYFAVSEPNCTLAVPREGGIEYVNVNYGSPVVLVEDPTVIEALKLSGVARVVKGGVTKETLAVIVKPDGSIVREAYNLAYQSAQ